MISKEELTACVEAILTERPELFLVDIAISKDNIIEVTIESETSGMTLDDCVWISRKIEEKFDREKEDYELTVGSAGLDTPFKVRKQYDKAVGSEVEVQFKGGRKIIGILTAADDSGITLSYEQLETVEGKKRRVKVQHNDRFGLDEVNSVRFHIIFN